MTIKNFIKKWHGKGVEDYGGIVSPEFVQFTKDFRAALNGICKAINADLVTAKDTTIFRLSLNVMADMCTCLSPCRVANSR